MSETCQLGARQGRLGSLGAGIRGEESRGILSRSGAWSGWV